MKKDIKERWVKALRSGEYRQCQGVLRGDDDHFCCLGVLCDLAAKEGVLGAEWAQGPASYEIDGFDAVLPLVVRDWAGLEAGNPRLGLFDAIYWNDHRGADFHQLADLIEKHL